MVNTRKSSRIRCDPFISSRTRSSSRAERNSEDHKEPGSDASTPSSPRLGPPSKRTRRQTASGRSSSDTSPSPQAKGQRVSWDIPTYRTRLSSRIMQNGHALRSRRSEDSGGGDHSHINGHVELKRSCRVKKSQFEHLNQSLLFDQLVNSTAEAVLQEMDNITSIRQSREVERLRMWTRDTEEENMDMYSRVKRRKSMRRCTFNMPAHHKVMGKTEEEEEEDEEEVTEESHGEEEEEDAEEDDEDDEGDEAEEAEENDRPYNLRQRKTVQRYEAPPIEPVNRKQSNPSLFDTHRSPARRSHIRVKKHAIHSSDTTSSSDEERFERRKSKSMTRARNRCLPMNLTAEDLACGVLRDRVKVGASLADVDPMNLDNSVRFDSVGGLSYHIQSLKEMVVFPLLYPEVFEKFKIQPPRGCLFYGPPGTGKTLVARALANECSRGNRKVSFFMRKGADCLSKWVGESERQLRLLFDQAYLMRPSIIFFDEIDGLAPVRSSRQDQIHSSIVSTLLALMDGLDSRGEIVVIGATNRLDSIDPALRRPGRFDREFLFSLPDKKARKQILKIHTRDWNPKLSEPFLDELAEKCVGYCGADIKALCTEAALMALRRRYPQIYGSSVKLKLDVTSIVLGPSDFSKAMRTIVPASQRALAPPGRALSPVLRPLLDSSFSLVLKALLRVFPHAQPTDRDNTQGGDNHLLEEDLYSDDNEDGSASIYEVQPAASPKSQPSSSAMHRTFLHFSSSALQQPTSYRPRLLLAGAPGSGQSSHLAPALLHHLDKLPVHRLDLPTLYSISAKTPEESCAQVFREARRSMPSVVYMPHISEWWDTVSDTVRSTFITLLQDVPSFSPVLFLATAEMPYSKLSDEVRSMFQKTYGEVVILCPLGVEERRNFFSDLILVQAARPPPRLRSTERSNEVLQVAETPGQRVLSVEEQRRLAEQEENTLRELRLFLRDVTKRLATDKRFSIFSKPVDIEEVSDYLEVIRQPMDLSTIMTKIDTHRYLTVKDFLVDIDLICSNALEYNPDKDPGDKVIRHRACSLKDTAHAIFAAELDPEFDRMCEEIKEARKKRDFQSPVQPAASAGAPPTRKNHGPAEEQAKSSTQGETMEKSCTTNHIKKKIRRRPSWGRGIIRKKKIYKKEMEEEEEEPEAEVEGAAPSDSCLTQDEESSCDTVGPQPNGHHPHVPSTEEESSNEPPDKAHTNAPDASDAQQGPKLEGEVKEPPAKEVEVVSAGKHVDPCCLGGFSQSMADGDSCAKTSDFQPLIQRPESSDALIQPHYSEGLLTSQVGHVNGTESMDSLDSQSLKSGDEAHTRTPQSAAEDINKPEQEEHKDESKSTQEQLPLDGGPPTERTEEDRHKEDGSNSTTSRMTATEQLQGPAGRAEEEPHSAPPLPPVVVDHQRLEALLDMVVKKSEGFSVEQLERLYSLLSQCIYQHRREYDKSRLLEEMEAKTQHFHTFL